MLQIPFPLRSSCLAALLLLPAAAAAQAGGGNAAAGQAGTAPAGSDVPTGGLGNPGAPEGAPGVARTSPVASPNAVPTVGNGQGIDTSLSAASNNDSSIATETQERISENRGRDDGRGGGNWGLLGLLGLAGLAGLRGRRRS